MLRPPPLYNKNHCLLTVCHQVARHVQSFLESSASVLGVCHKARQYKSHANWSAGGGDFVPIRQKCTSSQSVRRSSSIGFNCCSKTRATSNTSDLASCQNKPQRHAMPALCERFLTSHPKGKIIAHQSRQCHAVSRSKVLKYDLVIARDTICYMLYMLYVTIFFYCICELFFLLMTRQDLVIVRRQISRNDLKYFW